MAVRSLPDLYLPEAPPAPYVPPTSTLSRPTASAINRAAAQEVSLTLPGFDEVVPLIFGEARTTGLWLVRPYVHGGTGNLRFAILWSWGEIEGVQAVYLNGQAVSSGHMTHYGGTSSQAADTKLATDIPGFADAYTDWAYTVFDIPAATYTGVPQTMQIEAVVRGIKVNNPDAGSPAPIAARYWRLHITETRSTTTPSLFATIAEMEYRATIGGADQTGSGTASASSTNTGTTAAAAFDNDDATIWGSSGGASSPQWIAYDFGSSTTVREITITSGNTSVRAERAPRTFEVQYSDDGTDWETAVTYTDETAWAATETRTFEVPELAPSATMWTQNPARCAAHWAMSTDFGPGDTVTGLEDCADRCDELVGGVEVRCEVGIVIDTPMTREAMWDILAAYGEFLWSDQGDGVLMVPDAPVGTVSVTVARSDIVGDTLRLTADPLSSAPTEVTVIYREPSGDASQWQDKSETVQLAGVDTGIVAAVRSELTMPGVQRDSEAGRKALLRLRRLQHPGKFAWQAYDDGIKYQRGDVVQLPDTRGMVSRQVRVLSMELVSRGIYQVTAEAYDPADYPDDYTPGSTTTVPVGGILPYIGSGVPAGYDLFTAADGRFLVGAGNTWARGDLFGDTAFTISGNTSTKPSHRSGVNGLVSFPSQDNRDPGTKGLYRDTNDSGGEHFHAYSVAQDRTPAYAQTKLIVKTGTPGDVPADGGVWADGDLIAAAYSALSTAIGKLVRAGSSVATGGSQLSYAVDVGIQPAGGHTHASDLFGYSSGVDFPIDHWDLTGSDRGEHTHPSSITVNLSIPRKKLAHFVAGTSTDIVPGAIIGFDSDAALPTGWEEAGTIDFWIERSSVGDAGDEAAGTRQATWNGSTGAGGAHDHKGVIRRDDYVYTRNVSHDFGDSHTHTVSGAVAYDPPSYAMRFIQYTGAV